MLKLNKQLGADIQAKQINSIHQTNKSNTMKNLVKHVLKFSAATIAIAVPLITSSYSANAQQQRVPSLADCRNATVRGLNGGVATLTATCPTANGASTVTSTVVLNGFNNRNGNIVFVGTGTGRSDIVNSCSSIRVTGSTLSASCRRTNNTFNDSARITIRSVGVRNGNLVQIL